MKDTKNNKLFNLGLSAFATVAFSSTSFAASLAVNFSNGGVADTEVGSGENTAALNTAVGLVNPTWYNVPITGTGSIANGKGSGTFSSIGVSAYSANYWKGGSWAASGSDASQQVFNIYLDDGNGSDGDNTYFNGDGIGASIHLTNIAQYLAANNATSYTLTLFYSTDTSSSSFRTTTVYSGVAGTPSATAITSLTSLGTVTATVAGDGKYPISGVGTVSGGTRGYGTLANLTADNLVITMPSTGGGRGSIAGFAITTVPEPSSLALSLLGTLGLLRRRRR